MTSSGDNLAHGALRATLPDQTGASVELPAGERCVVVFLKEECPTCKQALPVINAAATSGRVIGIGQDPTGNQQLVAAGRVEFPLLDDADLHVSYDQSIEIVPTLIVVDEDGHPQQRLEGFVREEWRTLLTAELGAEPELDWESLPEWSPGCGSLSLDPAHAARLAAEASGSPLRARQIEVGNLDDEFEFMFDQGFTDGLPVVPPTPERVLRMLAGTSRDPQEVVAVLPPNMGDATVEKIAINAVLAGCRPDYLPVVLAAVEAMATDEFNIHGVMATTMGAAPVLVVNGPIRDRIGMNMMTRAAPQFNVFSIGFPITMTVGFLVITANLPIFLPGLERLLIETFSTMGKMIFGAP